MILVMSQMKIKIKILAKSTIVKIIAFITLLNLNMNPINECVPWRLQLRLSFYSDRFFFFFFWEVTHKLVKKYLFIYFYYFSLFDPPKENKKKIMKVTFVGLRLWVPLSQQNWIIFNGPYGNVFRLLSQFIKLINCYWNIIFTLTRY